MSPANQARYAREHRQALRKAEAYAEAVTRKALSDQLAAALTAFDADSDPASAVFPGPIQAAVTRIFETVGMAFARAELGRYLLGRRKVKADDPAAVSVGFYSARWRELMRVYAAGPAGEHITRITETTRNLVRQALAEAAEQGLDKRKTAKYLQKRVGEFNKNRALLIARTETTTAANYGAWLAAAETEGKKVKTWIATRDSRTRDAHRAVNGQMVDMDAPFIVGGVPMKYPGDPAGGAKNVCNCRCATAYEMADTQAPPDKPKPKRSNIFVSLFTAAKWISSLLGDSSLFG